MWEFVFCGISDVVDADPGGDESSRDIDGDHWSSILIPLVDLIDELDTEIVV